MKAWRFIEDPGVSLDFSTINFTQKPKINVCNKNHACTSAVILSTLSYGALTICVVARSTYLSRIAISLQSDVEF